MRLQRQATYDTDNFILTTLIKYIIMDIKTIFRDITNVTLPIIRKYREEIQNIEVIEKKDHTLLTEADILVQKAILEVIQSYDQNCQFIAEENVGLDTSNSSGVCTWIVDPIDGTKEFVAPEGKEFCTAICVLREGTPIGAMVLLPELGHKGKPVLIEATSDFPKIFLNGTPIPIPSPENDIPKKISATRSRGTEPRSFESRLITKGCTLKTRTTSQTIDLLRVAIDLSAWTEPSLDSFDLFYRQKQKLWDGAPGIFLNHMAGRVAVDEKGQNILPFSKELLDQSAPILPVTIVGAQKYITWFLALRIV